MVDIARGFMVKATEGDAMGTIERLIGEDQDKRLQTGGCKLPTPAKANTATVGVVVRRCGSKNAWRQKADNSNTRKRELSELESLV